MFFFMCACVCEPVREEREREIKIERCSAQPLMPAKTAFRREGSINLFERRKGWKREARTR